MKLVSSVRLGAAILLCVMATTTQIHSQTAETSPDVTAPLIVKLAGFEKNLSGSSKDLSIYVMGSPAMYAVLGNMIGTKIGNSTIANVMSGADLPIIQPAILYLGDQSKTADAIKYTRAKKILSVSGIPDLVNSGITLGIGLGDDGKPSILLNIESSKEENLVWNPAILKIAKTVK